MMESRKPNSQPALQELMARFLNHQSIAPDQVPQSAEVVPYEAVPVQPVDARVAWNEAIVPLRCFSKQTPASVEIPQDWPALVSGYEPVAALACCAGNFPQLVRDVHGLLKATDLSTLPANSARPITGTSFLGWAEDAAGRGDHAELLLALGVCRLARQYDQAEALRNAHQPCVPAEWQTAWANEEAALAWHRGDTARASALWQKQAPSAPVLFNQGMAALFLGDASQARPLLGQAVKQFPEDEGWHHLGNLYLALAEMRS